MTKEQQELAENNMMLVYKFLNKYNIVNIDDEDYFWVAYCRGIIGFNPQYGSQLSTYIFTVLKRAYSSYYRSTVIHSVPIYCSLEDKCYKDECDMTMEEIIADAKNDYSLSDLMKQIDRFEKTLKPKEKSVFKYMKSGYDIKWICKELGQSQSMGYYLKNKIIRKYFKFREREEHGWN